LFFAIVGSTTPARRKQVFIGGITRRGKPARNGTLLGRFLIESAHDRCGALCTKPGVNVL
jgi:hypothetical protein